jgi:2-polyprenyl-3-methyl-5-hydroxy-6-metoxy-1,4-benzoquinol methylase
MMMMLRQVRWGYTMTDTVNVPMARNLITRGFLDTDAHYLMFIDQDMVFQPQHAQELIEAIQDRPDAGCIAGFYVKRDGSQVPLCAWLDKERPWLIEANDKILDRLEAGRGTCVEADVLPTGFMIIRREAIESVKEPWFHILYPTMADGEVSPDMWSSDTVFCHKLREAGWKTYCHLGIEVGHIGDFIYHPQHFWSSLSSMRSIHQRDTIKQQAAEQFGVNSEGYWSTVWKAEADLGIERDYEVLHKHILAQIPENSSVLDIGCGVGQLMSRAREVRGCRVTGLDLSRRAVEICKEHGLEAEQFDILNDQLPPAYHHAFDVVVATEVVEHFEDETKLLKLAHAALKPGGTFVLSCPADCSGPSQEPEHVRTISDTEVLEWFSHYDDVGLAKVNHYWMVLGKKKEKVHA